MIGANQKTQRMKCIPIRLPETLSLSKDPDSLFSVASEIQKYREKVNKKQNLMDGPIYYDFKDVRHIGPGAGLLLLAEMQAVTNYSESVRLRVHRNSQWNSNVVYALKSMGFFKILKVDGLKRILKNPQKQEQKTIYLEFLTGVKAIGEKAEQMRLLLQKKFPGGEQGWMNSLYDGLVEAMTNSQHHAYPDSVRDKITMVNKKIEWGNEKKRWWMSAAFCCESWKFSITFCDLGVGIYQSLYNKLSALDQDYLRNLLGLKDHGEIIKGAFELGRSSTKLGFRGKGLEQMRSLIYERRGASITISSGKGFYMAETTQDLQMKEEVRELSNAICGTIIQWRFTGPGV
ncbi:MAG: hypothetical protein SF002_07460 [Alphaproteobacteria bacterium]|nr:hypothetical protein [Alphaproteobacteria bacterium]